MAVRAIAPCISRSSRPLHQTLMLIFLFVSPSLSLYSTSVAFEGTHMYNTHTNSLGVSKCKRWPVIYCKAMLVKQWYGLRIMEDNFVFISVAFYFEASCGNALFCLYVFFTKTFFGRMVFFIYYFLFEFT